MTRIRATPGEALSYRPTDAHYLHRGPLKVELERVFDVCQGCRLCFNLCPTFPALFEHVDRHDGEVCGLTSGETAHIVGTCYQCRLCYLRCPYTPDDKHEFQLDFPRLMLRAKAVDASERGVGLRERVLGDPDLLGWMGGLFPRLANLANRLGPARMLMDWMLGIHREKILPSFHGQTFQQWYNRHRGEYRLDGDNGKVFYFQTCFVNFNNPEIGKAAIDVFAQNGLTVRCDYRNCCGMPALDGGDIPRAQKLARRTIAHLLPYVKQGYKILATNPTCSMMMRKEYPELIGGEEAAVLANAVMDPQEYLDQMRREGRFNQEFRSSPGRINYHVPCHLRFQNIGYRSRDLMQAIRGGTEIELVAECSGHDGTWAMKSEYFRLSLAAGAKAFAGMKRNGALMVTDCPLAALQIQQATGRRPIHPLQVLARAYREDGFGHRPESPPT